MPAVIRPFDPSDQAQVVSLVLRIQRDEFLIPITAEEQPDLRDVPTHYLAPGGAFWVGADGPEIVGTLGLLNIGAGDLALRKMFLAPNHRGAHHGLAARLLATARDWASAGGFSRILLGTTEQFQAAHRFYEKSGFTQVPVDSLPASFPRMRLDTRFYQLHLRSRG
jgi:GNAT superfamily N-acetyltransferase